METTPDDGHEITDPGEVNVDQVIQELITKLLGLSVEKPTCSSNTPSATEEKISTPEILHVRDKMGKK